MKTTTKTWKKPLRTLTTAELAAATGGIIIYGSTSLESDSRLTTGVGNPEDSTAFTGGVSYLPAVQR